MISFLDFEKPIAELEGKIRELRRLSEADEVNLTDEVGRLESKLTQLMRQTYGQLTPWQKTQVARHPDRPHFTDYVAALIDDFTPLAGDRGFGDDHAIIGGLGRLRGQAVLVIGHEKGNDTQSRIFHNFGMARPEGYRKVARLMRLADRFGLPIVTLVDTPGAYPGVGAEERGQAEAIARSTQTCLEVRVPIISAIVGEGGSGGAIAIATGNRVLMMQHAIYSVISPEGCASILWRKADKAQDAASALKITAEDLMALGVIDVIVQEPLGGAHRDPAKAIARLGDELEIALRSQMGKSPDQLRSERREKFLAMGQAQGARK